MHQRSSRIAGLDGVRAFAVIIVIGAHAHVPFLHGGGVGVDIFFGLSGFLITYLLLGEQHQFNRIDLWRFWLRRALRLLPALLAMVALVDLAALSASVLTSSDALESTLAATPGVLLYFGNWMIVGTSSPVLGWFGPMWSLAVEEQFYLIWPIVVILALRTRHGVRLLALVAALLVVGATVGRFFSFDGTNMYRTFGTDFRVDMLAIGALLAMVLFAGHHMLVRRISRVTAVPAVLVLTAAIVVMPDFNSSEGADFQKWYYWVGLPLVGLATASIIGYLFTHQHSSVVKMLEWRPIAYSGSISYGLYLWHYPVLMAIATVYREINPLLWFAIGLALTYLFAALSFRLLERPLSTKYGPLLRPDRVAMDTSKPSI